MRLGLADRAGKRAPAPAHPTAVPGAAPPSIPLTTPTNSSHTGVSGDTYYPYVDSALTKDGAQILSRIAKCEPRFEQFGSFGSLKNALDTPAGWPVHHIVEQNQTNRFGTEIIQTTSNTIALPQDVHDAITDVYRRAPQDAALANQFPTFRSYVQSLPFDRQREVAIDVLKAAIDKVNPPPEICKKIESQLNRIEHPDMCAPGQKAPNQAPPLPSIDDVNNAVNNHNQQSNRPLPDVRSVAGWDGTTRSGTFVDLGDGTVAQHQGAGAYAIANVSRDLNGVQPPIGQYATLQQNGRVQVPQQTQSLQMGLG